LHQITSKDFANRKHFGSSSLTSLLRNEDNTNTQRNQNKRQLKFEEQQFCCRLRMNELTREEFYEVSCAIELHQLNKKPILTHQKMKSYCENILKWMNGVMQICQTRVIHFESGGNSANRTLDMISTN
jgi:hypothetical protein